MRVGKDVKGKSLGLVDCLRIGPKRKRKVYVGDVGEPGLETEDKLADVEKKCIFLCHRDAPPFVLTIMRRDMQAFHWRWGLWRSDGGRREAANSGDAEVN